METIAENAATPLTRPQDTTAAPAESAAAPARHAGSPLALLCLTAMGVVYGDIGTSPLYAVRECFFGPHGVPVTHDNVLGVLSLIVWSLIIVVTLKYHVYVLRADNRGEGGILALMSLVRDHEVGARRTVLVALGLFGAALLYGDGVLTPAISVLGAIEGLEIATPFFAPYVVPITIVILIGLFLLQRRGTTGVGIVFGPVIALWFSTLALLGVYNIVQQPQVVQAVNPLYAYHFLVQHGVAGYLVLGSVFLVATGGEALYADLGHFGEKPMRRHTTLSTAWLRAGRSIRWSRWRPWQRSSPHKR
jgi:KUP system potassium uptake protein